MNALARNRWTRATLLAAALLASSCGGAPPEQRGNKRILVLGDSITEGEGLPADRVFPAALERLIRAKGYPGVTVTADGMGGALAQSGPGRLDLRLPEKYDILVLELGANDGLRGLDVEEMKRHLSTVITKAQGAGMKVVLAGVRIPPHHGAQYKEEFLRAFRDLAKEKGCVLVPHLLKGVALNPSLNLPDGIHPNERGHLKVAETVFRTLEPLL